MKTRLALDKAFCLNPSKMSDVAENSDVIKTHIDCGGANNGILYIVPAFRANSDMTNVGVWTSATSDFLTTLIAASDTSAATQIVITSDADTLWAKTNANTPLTTALTVTGNEIVKIKENGIYGIACRNLKRYLNVQYDSAGSTSKIAMIFVAEDMPEAPYGPSSYNGGRAGY